MKIEEYANKVMALTVEQISELPLGKDILNFASIITLFAPDFIPLRLLEVFYLHLNAENNPMTEIYSLAPQRDEVLLLTLKAEEGGFVGLKFNPVYNAQWKETGEWQQSYSAYPKEGYKFAGWFNEDGSLFCKDEKYIDTYGASRVLKAAFEKI